jgi:catechol-2,3-dioxygenase
MTKNIHHLGLTVESLKEAKDFFIQILDWKVLKEDPEYPSVFLSNGDAILTIWKAQVESPIKFNRKHNIGLHHFALLVNSKKELMKIYQTIQASHFEVEFEPRLNGENLHFMVEGPSKIRIEFITLKRGL